MEELFFSDINASNTEPMAFDPDLRGTLEVTESPTTNVCNYKFSLSVTNSSKFASANNVAVTFKLASGFTAPDPAVSGITFVNGNITWTVDKVKNETKRTSFYCRYTGPANETIVTSLKGTYGACTPPAIFTVKDIGKIQKTADCTSTNPCCETCNDSLCNEVTIPPCTDFVEKTVEPNLLPTGRMLRVNLSMSDMCTTKDATVGVFVTELIGTEEVAIAHRIIYRPRNSTPATGTCSEDRSCDCVQFMIYDTPDRAYETRTFRIRTAAHYIDNPENMQPCQCDDCTRP